VKSLVNVWDELNQAFEVGGEGNLLIKGSLRVVLLSYGQGTLLHELLLLDIY